MIGRSQHSSICQKKRPKAGHEKTRLAICLDCYESSKANPEKKFWLTRFNQSTIDSHSNRIHEGKGYRIHSEDDPRVAEALTEYKKRYDYCI